MKKEELDRFLREYTEREKLSLKGINEQQRNFKVLENNVDGKSYLFEEMCIRDSAKAMPRPVFPAVASIIVLPGFSRPCCSAF